jgi:hypothetical protein
MAASAAQEQPPHPAVSRPALLSHIFKFAARELKDVKLLHVDTAWEDTAVNFCPWMWERLTRTERDYFASGIPPLQDTATAAADHRGIEQYSQYAFNFYVCRVWVRRVKRQSPQLFARLAVPRTLDLRANDRVTDAAMAFICSHASLVRLSVAACEAVTDAGMASVGNLAGSLEQIDMSQLPRVTDAALADVAKVTQLRCLNASGIQKLTDKGVAHIAALTSLRVLILRGTWQLTDTGLQSIAGLQQLQTLNLDRCDKITDAGLQHIAGLQHLQTLNIGFCDLVTDAGVQHLSGLQQLQTLNLTQCRHLTGAHLAALHSLVRLDAARCYAFSDASLVQLGNVSSLRSLWVRGCSRLSLAAKAEFKQANPACTLLE